MRERDGNAAGAGADVGDSQRVHFFAPRAEALERYFDHVFGFRARNQDGGRHFEIQAPEFLLAG